MTQGLSHSHCCQAVGQAVGQAVSQADWHKSVRFVIYCAAYGAERLLSLVLLIMEKKPSELESSSIVRIYSELSYKACRCKLTWI